MKIATLKRRAEFLRIRGGGRWSGPAFVLEGKPRDESAAISGPRFGFTVTRKIGNAVVRNRIRRRLKAVLQTMSAETTPSYDYVVIARQPALDRSFTELQQDMVRALARVAAGPQPPRARPSRSQEAEPRESERSKTPRP